jgi:voltage-gated sodium channel
MTELARRLAHSATFQNFITLVIILAGILVGIETSPGAVALYGDWLHTLDRIVLCVFVAEICIKLAAEGNKPWRYFRDPFNVFDFTVVVVTLLPFGGQYVTVLRLLRLLRVLRLVHALPRLQILVSALLKSIPSMAYVGVFLGLLFYVYGVAGVFLFGKNDPAHFGSLAVAMLTLFTVVTLEGWAELMYTQMYGCDPGTDAATALLCRAPEAHPGSAPLYFVSFVLFGTMIVLNLFIGVIMNSMQEAAVETERAEQTKRQLKGTGQPSFEHELNELHRAAQHIAERVKHMQARQRSEARSTPSGAEV